MPTLLYIHGFLSSPASLKAQQTLHWLQQNRPDWRFVCPLLSSYPGEAHAELCRLVEQDLLAGEPVYIIGSSLGGFWATALTERFGFKSALINPAVSPHKRFVHLVGQTLHNYHSGEPCRLTELDLAILRELDTPVLTRKDLYWLLAQTGDETLDYRDAVAKYAGCRQQVEEGGSHAFDGFIDRLPGIIAFFEQPVC